MPSIPAHRAAPLLSGLLATAAILYQGFQGFIAFDPDDTNHLETPLAMAVARQLEEGPSTLYGPFDGHRPLVLVHAPIYYRLAGLGAWILHGAGVSPEISALAAGRALAWLGAAAAVAGIWRLARLDGAPKFAGLWAALMFAGSSVMGSFAVTIRPDTLGIAFQTWGAVLVLRTLLGSKTSKSLIGGFALFGLAACVKQHDVLVAAVSALLLGVSVVRGGVKFGVAVVALGVCLAVIAGYYGLEEWLTGGRMSESVFLLPGQFRRIAYAGWPHVARFFFEVGKRSLPIALLGIGGMALGRGRGSTTRLDGVLWLYLAAELAGMVPLCLGSTGAWVNYALQAVAFGSVLAARSLAFGALPSASCWRWAPALAAGVFLAITDARLVWIAAEARVKDRESLRSLAEDPAFATCPPIARYFVSVPQYNRLYGNARLAHDEWLFDAYEALDAAEPRELWLKSALVDGPVRVVVTTGTRSDVPGISATLPALGYEPVGRFGRFQLWRRPDPGSYRVGRGAGP